MKSKNTENQLITSVSRHQVMEVFKSMDFTIDLEGIDILILRNSKFPFHRIAIPNDEMISVELLKKYANDLGIPFEIFLP